MRVFCRFAPTPANCPGANLAATAAMLGADAAADGQYRTSAASADVLLLLQAEEPPSAAMATTAASTTTTTGARVLLADPTTLSKASFSCDGAFLPPKATAATPAVTAAQQQHLYEVTCKSLLDPAPLPLEQQQQSCSRASSVMAARRIYLAYGQTASGKTYSLFGDTSAQCGVQELSPSAGVVPRYLHDVFSARNGAAQTQLCHTDSDSVDSATDGVFVDVSCFEVYNEVTTDLVALSVALSSSDFPHSASATSAARVSTGRHLRFKTPIDAAGGVANPLRSPDLRRQLPVCVAHHLYRREQQPDDADAYTPDSFSGTRSETSMSEMAGHTATFGASVAPPTSPPTLSRLKTEYKATERQQVLRSLERARCTTFAEAQGVLQALLALRQECATSRNQSSSRGHLVLCVQVYAPAARDNPAGLWVMQHETAFVDLAGSECGNLADADVADVRASKVVYHKPKQRGRATTAAASPSRAGSQHSRVSLDTSMQSGTSSQYSAVSHDSTRNSFGTTTTTASAYHRSLLRPPPEEDKKAALERRRRETRFINASLLALRKVFRALHEATRLSHAAVIRGPTASAAPLPHRPPLHHAPFKDSALTAILESFLVPQPTAVTSSYIAPAGPKRTEAVHVVLLLCCSSRSVDFFETVASLRLGAEATAVNPEIVLRALPVQQREQQQQQQQLFARAARLQSHRNSVSHRYRDSSACAALSSQPLFRSASAPSRRLVPAGDEGAHGEAEDFGGCTSAPVIRAAVKRHDQGRPGEVVMSAADAARLRDEARQYKETAQQLYEQCKSLCESYDECVDELRQCRVALSERDARVAELEAALEKVTRACAADTSQQPHRPLQEPRQPYAPKAIRNGTTASVSPSTCIPHPLRLQRTSREAAAKDESAEVFPAAGDGGKCEEHAALVPSETASVAAGGLRATSVSSTAREGSGRWTVSVSPFSTASLGAGTGGRMAMVGEGAEDILDEGSSGGSVSNDADDTRWARTMCSRRSSSARCQSCGPPFERQRQHARCIMDTLLERQIFHSDTPVEPTQSPSAPRASSPSPVLPALSARGTAETALSLGQQQARSDNCCQESESDARVSRKREPHSNGSQFARETGTAVGEPPYAQEVAGTCAATAAASASLSAPRQSHNTARSSSAGATASSSMERRGSGSAGRSSWDRITEGPEVDSVNLPSPAAAAAGGVVAPAAAVTTSPTTAVWSKDLSSRTVSHTSPDDSPLRATSRQTIAMAMGCNGEVPHARAAPGGNEADVVEEVVIQLKKRDNRGAPLISAATYPPMETVRHVEAKSKAALMPPCRTAFSDVIASVPAALPASPVTEVYQL
ncbi:hypothetical protein CUR178_07155 [Leishmania enriettii]|uniref:Kinesin motor domain-containing protein n=1 Tax=Leishmania enriettii TaxID=5663 RepID=A0A836KR88_LEIEN|nr:hypothetical protein CUR178_07155 [Leishmania enriettii]